MFKWNATLSASVVWYLVFSLSSILLTESSASAQMRNRDLLAGKEVFAAAFLPHTATLLATYNIKGPTNLATIDIANDTVEYSTLALPGENLLPVDDGHCLIIGDFAPSEMWNVSSKTLSGLSLTAKFPDFEPPLNIWHPFGTLQYWIVTAPGSSISAQSDEATDNAGDEPNWPVGANGQPGSVVYVSKNLDPQQTRVLVDKIPNDVPQGVLGLDFFGQSHPQSSDVICDASRLIFLSENTVYPTNLKTGEPNVQPTVFQHAVQLNASGQCQLLKLQGFGATGILRARLTVTKDRLSFVNVGHFGLAQDLICALIASPTDPSLATITAGGHIRIYSVTDGSVLRDRDLGPDYAFGTVSYEAFSGDGRSIAVAAVGPRYNSTLLLGPNIKTELIVLDSDTLTVKYRSFGRVGYLSGVALNEDGSKAAFWGDLGLCLRSF
jgi:hypothetical protein